MSDSAAFSQEFNISHVFLALLLFFFTDHPITFVLHQMACHTVDFHEAERATQSIRLQTSTEYQPQTLTQDNRGRCVYLPIFPTKDMDPDKCLLLTNVPSESEKLNRKDVSRLLSSVIFQF